jgi:energy-coupling factor transport system ATP-binding protein
MIEASALSYRYPERPDQALDDLQLQIPEGSLTLMSGGTGSGKSTFALACVGAVPRYTGGQLQGELLLAGSPVKGRPVFQLASQVGLLMQNVEHQIFTDQVEDEIAFGLENVALSPSDIEDRLTAALELAGAQSLRHRALAMLSAGERQRVALAAVLALDQPIVILDEPFAYLDRLSGERLLQTLSALADRGRTVLLLEHRRDLVRARCSREIRLHRGRVTAEPINELTREPLAADAVGAEEVALEVRGLTVCRNGEDLVREGCLRLAAGQSAVLLGDNGCGKTTLFRTLMGLEPWAGGQGTLAGLPLGRASTRALVQRVRLVLQNPDHQLTQSRVVDELGKGDLSELAEMGLSGTEQLHPQSLSVGQKRRLTLATALSHRPRVLLLDEPTVGQDDESLALLLNRLERYVLQGGALLAATHDARVARILGGRCYVLEDRRLQERPVESYFGEAA